MPPLLNYQGSVSPSNTSNKTSVNRSSPLKQRLDSQSAPSYSVNSNSFTSSNVVPTTTSWLKTFSGVSQKRPPPAHSGSILPPAKRPYLDNMDKSATPSPNSNMSPLVDLDQLCNLLDNDRSSSSEELSLRFPSDFSVPSTSQSRNVFNISPSDIISLD